VSTLVDSVETLSKKTDTLIRALREGREKRKGLEQDNARLAEKVERMANDFERLKEENKVLRMASALKGDPETVAETKRRISKMVREIDRCIAKLSD
jgi:hypothetical protein